MQYFEKAQAIGEVHLTHKKGSKSDGNEMIKIVKKSLARALKQNGQDAEAKQIMDELVQQAIREKEEADRNKAEKEKEQKK